MTQRILITVSVFVTLLLFGCSVSIEKPLRGLVIQSIEIEGNQPRAVVTALTSVLSARGATIGGKNGVILRGTAKLEFSGDEPNMLTVDIRSQDGNLSALVQAVSDPFLHSEARTPEALAKLAAAKVAAMFRTQFSRPGVPAPQASPPQRDKIG